MRAFYIKDLAQLRSVSLPSGAQIRAIPKPYPEKEMPVTVTNHTLEMPLELGDEIVVDVMGDNGCEQDFWRFRVIEPIERTHPPTSISTSVSA